MKKKEKALAIGDVLGNFGFAFEFFKAIADAVRDRDGTMEHMRRVVKESALQKQIAELIVPACSSAMKSLGENEYLVSVGYDMPRDKGKLEAEFSKDGVSDLYFVNYEWQPHSSCAELDQTPGSRIMLLKHFGCSTKSEANIAEMDKQGYRPATHLEAYAFQKANPELQRQLWIIALGSSVMCGDYRYVAVLGSDSDMRVLDIGVFSRNWTSDDHFLFVRKTASAEVSAGGPVGSETSTFSAPVVYLQPEFEELLQRFPGYVMPDFKGKRFDPIERCKSVSKENREVTFECVHMTRDATTDEVLAEMDRKGLRPALYEEVLGFAEKYPDEQRKYPIVALGSETRRGGTRGVACLWGDGCRRDLNLSWIYGAWHRDCRFPAVRK
jgi:hypothetical protein